MCKALCRALPHELATITKVFIYLHKSWTRALLLRFLPAHCASAFKAQQVGLIVYGGGHHGQGVAQWEKGKREFRLKFLAASCTCSRPRTYFLFLIYYRGYIFACSTSNHSKHMLLYKTCIYLTNSAPQIPFLLPRIKLL